MHFNDYNDDPENFLRKTCLKKLIRLRIKSKSSNRIDTVTATFLLTFSNASIYNVYKFMLHSK